MGLCRLCQGITLPALVSKTGYKHQQSLEALQQSAKQCALCNLFLSATLSATDPKELSCYLMKNIHQSQIDLKAYDGPFFEPDRLDRLSTLVVYVEDLGVASLSLYTEAGKRHSNRGTWRWMS